MKRTLKTIFIVLSTIFALTGFIICFVIAILFVEGSLNIERADMIGKVLRGEKIDVKVVYREKKPEEYAEEINLWRQAEEERLRKKEEENKSIESHLLVLKSELELKEKNLTEREKDLAEEKKLYAEQKRKDAEKLADENFKKNLKNFGVMDEKTIANIFASKDWDVKEIVKYLRQMKERKSASILETLFKIDQQKAIQISKEMEK